MDSCHMTPYEFFQMFTFCRYIAIITAICFLNFLVGFFATKEVAIIFLLAYVIWLLVLLRIYLDFKKEARRLYGKDKYFPL